MTIRTSDADDQRLSALAARWKVSKHTAVLRAVEQAAEREVGLDEVDEISQRVMARRATALAKLADL